MKRVLVAAMLLLGTVSVFAAEGKIDREKVKQEVKKEVKTSNYLAVKDKSCTVTISGSVGFPPYAGATFCCSATAETCTQAWDDTDACVAEGIRRGKKKFEDFINSIKSLWPF